MAIQEVARPEEQEPVAEKLAPRRKPLYRRLIRWMAVLIVGVLVATELIAVSFIWYTPSRTSYMLQNKEPVVYQYVSIDHISRHVLAATIAHEDQQLGTRAGGFDMNQFKERAHAYRNGQADPSGSTIPQQLVKNIFLWPDKNPVRKGIEAGLATEFSLTLSPKRELELYLNYAQFGPSLYGICAATWYYFNTPPSHVTPDQAASLMGVLPLPSHVQRARKGGFRLGPHAASPLAVDLILGAKNVWVPRQIKSMGGWKKAVATVGITDTAEDHADTASEADGCSTMPSSVRDLIKNPPAPRLSAGSSH